MGKSVFCIIAVCIQLSTRKVARTRIPDPLSWIWRSFIPPSLTVIRIEVAPASRLFSISSLRAEAGLWMIFSRSQSRWINKFGQADLSCSDFIDEFFVQSTNWTWFRHCQHKHDQTTPLPLSSQWLRRRLLLAAHCSLYHQMGIAEQSSKKVHLKFFIIIIWLLIPSQDLQLPPAFSISANEAISRAVELAYERDFSHIPSVRSLTSFGF